MGRGIQLACEECDFAATLYERVPFVLDAGGQLSPVTPEAATVPAGYWTDGLCGECRLPVRSERWHDQQGPDLANAAACPRCGAEPLAFDVALRELAEACHSRVHVDLAGEQAARRMIEDALDAVAHVQSALDAGETTTQTAIDALAAHLTPEHAPAASSAAPPLSATQMLVGLAASVENAATLQDAATLLTTRLQNTSRWVAGLQACVDDEAALPGVPCPQCATGHLAHWPLWL